MQASGLWGVRASSLHSESSRRDAYSPHSQDGCTTLSMREFRPRMQTERKFIAPHFVQEVLETSHGRDQIVTTCSIWKSSKRLSKE